MNSVDSSPEECIFACLRFCMWLGFITCSLGVDVEWKST